MVSPESENVWAKWCYYGIVLYYSCVFFKAYYVKYVIHVIPRRPKQN